MKSTIILLIASLLGVLLFGLLITKKNVNKVSTSFLACFYLIFSVFCAQTYILDSGLLHYFSWFYVWPLVLYALFPIIIYFYFLSAIQERIVWKKRYLLLFVPFVISLIDVIIIYSKPTAYYQSLIDKATVSPDARFDTEYTFMTLLEYYTFRHAWVLVALLSLYTPLEKFIKSKSKEVSKKIINNWLIVFYSIILITSFLTSLLGIEHLFELGLIKSIFHLENTYVSILIFFYIISLLIGFAPLYFPSILYGFKPIPSENSILTKGFSYFRKQQLPLLEINIDEELLDQKWQELEQQQIFLITELTITTLAQNMGVSPVELNHFFKKRYKMNFSLYINKLRVEYAKEKIDAGYFDNNNTNDLAQACGYENREELNRAFNLICGMKPKDYVYLKHMKTRQNNYLNNSTQK
ncbi:helix-turn-helix domain-containing protein [Flavobacterium sp. SUN046]|uniref:helix-turn-helix domain-containing protein n=1 Tax=Flavobacterium sp. SUN046 TaxID=3002440 RepID=UPI002DB5C552|nr:helix-turn-helix domain-containing protein [Flavobacterium sp. SUN046]MEC4050258.1 helix-turn-helix domain-containing protein [Flavobacterium sp. SUN046]